MGKIQQLLRQKTPINQYVGSCKTTYETLGKYLLNSDSTTLCWKDCQKSTPLYKKKGPINQYPMLYNNNYENLLKTEDKII